MTPQKPFHALPPLHPR